MTDPDAVSPQGEEAAAADRRNGRARVRVVGIGASAGGLEALGNFLAQVPPGSGLAYAVVQHLDPTQKAMLAQLLQRITPMPVREATQNLRIEPDCVYVIAPNRALTLEQGVLQVTAPEMPRGLRRPIDELFESLARELAGASVGIVLSGMGSDGSVGIEAIKARGGLTLAQQPETAQFDSMPRSAIATGCIDIVCEPGEMPKRVMAWLNPAAWTGANAAPAAIDDAGATAPAGPPARGGSAFDGLDRIIELLRISGKHDFGLYKHSTLLRRIERRMGIHRVPTLHAYEQMLRGNPQEQDLLFKELLIGVTAFFRDAAVWQALKALALPQLLSAWASRGDKHPLRAWVAGCSTGEEAYTLAMAFREVADAAPDCSGATLQIFATDLSRDAIDFARRALYPAAIARELSAERLDRFFTAQDNGYRVDKSIRETIVFAPHDLAVDPPFTKLDILSCRNLLIYLMAPLQRRLLPLFHYSLQPGGVLLLGSSETVGRYENLFEPLDAKQRLYRRREGERPVPVPAFPLREVSPAVLPHPEPDMAENPNPVPNLQAAADRLMLQELAPPAVLVNERGDILYINGRTGKYLEPAAGKANWNIHAMAREGLRAPLAAALTQASEHKHLVETHAVLLDDGDIPRPIDLSVRAVTDPAMLQGTLLVVFRDSPPVKKRRRRGNSPLTELETDLLHAREEAQALREEMRASHEELQASNEELQSTNEELQSTNEELTSSKEEMQSMNEELQAVNAELQSKLDDLALAQSDMRNLLNSTDIATLFLDKDLNVRRFTERARKIISLRDADIGRPLSDLTTSLEYPALEDDVKEMLRTMVVAERQIHSRDGRWYAVRVMPYRTQDDVIQGAVITFIDITASKELETRLRTGAS